MCIELKKCSDSKDIWAWVENLIKTKFQLNYRIPEQVFVDETVDKSNIKKVTLFIVSEAISYNIKHYKNGSLFDFLRKLRNIRWNNRIFLEKQFGSALKSF